MFYDIIHIAKRDTLCENQMDKLDNIGKIVENVATLWAMYDGFDVKYNPEKEIPKESIKEQYHAAKTKVYENWPEKKVCPFRPIFDAIHEAKRELHDRVMAAEPHFQHQYLEKMTPAMPHFAMQHMNMQKFKFNMPPPPMEFLKSINSRVPHYKMPEVQMPNLHLF